MHAETRTILLTCAKEEQSQITTRKTGHAVHMLESQWSSEELLSVTFDPVESVNTVTENIPLKKLYGAMEIAGKQTNCRLTPEQHKYMPSGTPIKETARSLNIRNPKNQ